MLIPYTELATRAADVVKSAGLTQMQTAERLGVAQSVVSRALRGVDSLDELRLRILREIGGLDVKGPLYEVK